MARPRGGLFTAEGTEMVSVRTPKDLVAAIDRAAGPGRGARVSWCRNVFRAAVGRPLDFEAGYQEGFARGWADANARFRKGMRQGIAETRKAD